MPDFDLSFLRELVRLLDSNLTELSKEADENDDPDMVGLYDRMEYVYGLGFAACQQYLTAKIGRDRMRKEFAISLGPCHRLGDPMAAILNAAANYWKHSAEWGSRADHRMEAQRDRTRRPLLKLGVDLQGPYPLSCVLSALLSPLPIRFETLLPFLVAWRDAWLDQCSSSQKGGVAPVS